MFILYIHNLLLIGMQEGDTVGDLVDRVLPVLSPELEGLAPSEPQDQAPPPWSHSSPTSLCREPEKWSLSRILAPSLAR